jgi:hypothetical protein
MSQAVRTQIRYAVDRGEAFVHGAPSGTRVDPAASGTEQQRGPT